MQSIQISGLSSDRWFGLDELGKGLKARTVGKQTSDGAKTTFHADPGSVHAWKEGQMGWSQASGQCHRSGESGEGSMNELEEADDDDAARDGSDNGQKE